MRERRSETRGGAPGWAWRGCACSARRGALVVGVAVGLSVAPTSAAAHDGLHDHMPHQVTAGLIPLYVAHYDGHHPGLVDGPIDELSVGALGVTLSYGYTLWQLLELRLRAEYLKPFPARAALAEGLHEFRGVLAMAAVVPLVGDRLQLALGPETGLAAWRLTTIEGPPRPFSSSHGLGYSLSFAASLRGWVTYHTGFWVEAGFGVSDASDAGGAGIGVASRWPLRVALGWADRF